MNLAARENRCDYIRNVQNKRGIKGRAGRHNIK